ncbi:unnamed protein product [Cylindrotheca closterium]|uniref:SRR1-like domain-containing protein n=1 Tax=Cylindrotheca closterium TaxID=2856 RepID=A0AAD2FTA7_9STRA|nr:unnamed protein product [Cylindrotheca closterium]
MASTDEWTTVTKSSRRCMRNRKREYRSSHSKAAERQQFDQDNLSLDDIAGSLQSCLHEVRISGFFQAFRDSLSSTIASSKEPIVEIVCYGVGNFGASKGCAPMFQLAFTIAVREILSPAASMYFYDPCMTQQESIVLERNSIQVIAKNERGRRRVQHKTLFLMPHCPLTLYSNLIRTNWDQLNDVIIFGNLLSAYTSRLGEVKSCVKLLKQVEPLWDESMLPISKQDLSDRSGQFEQAFNDSSLTHFQTTRFQDIFQQPPPSLDEKDDGGETI